MKRIFSIVLLVLICFASCVLPVYAEEIPLLADCANKLTYEEFNELNPKLKQLGERYQIAVVAVIEEEFYSYDAQSSADDWYDSYDYGTDGILFYISTEEREYHFSTCGNGITVFTDDAIEYFKQEVEPYLRADDYYGAINAYISVADEVLSLAESGMAFEQTDWFYVMIVIGGAVLFTFLIAFIMMGVQLAKMNTAVANDYARNYVKEGSYHLDTARDIFLYSRITKIKKAETTHTSSSGRTHGGGGGSF